MVSSSPHYSYHEVIRGKASSHAPFATKYVPKVEL